jgi:CRP/FNR family transcriptional regulator, cyclic AMP receptor protein
MDWELLQGLPEEEADQVLAAGRRRRFARREMIWHEGDRADTFHVIRSGRIAIQGTTSEGNLVTMAILGPGGAAGLLAVHGSEAYHTSSAVTLEATETLAIRIDDFVELRRRIQALNEAVIRLVTDRALNLSRQLVEALFVSADARVILRLRMLCEVYGPGNAEVVIPLTQEDLANLAGVTRPTVNRVLKKEEDRGTLRVARGSIVILDQARLSR